MNPIAILLAAGSSQRLGFPKQLAPLPHTATTLLNATIATIHKAGCTPIVVLGAYHQRIQRSIPNQIHTIINQKWSYGMGSSIVAGVREALSLKPPKILITTCDLPLLTHRDLHQLHTACNPPYDAVAAQTADQTPGVPACFAPSTYTALLNLSDQHGARKLLRDNVFRVRTLSLPNTLTDLDTPEDLRALWQNHEGSGRKSV